MSLRHVADSLTTCIDYMLIKKDGTCTIPFTLSSVYILSRILGFDKNLAYSSISVHINDMFL